MAKKIPILIPRTPLGRTVLMVRRLVGTTWDCLRKDGEALGAMFALLMPFMAGWDAANSGWQRYTALWLLFWTLKGGGMWNYFRRVSRQQGNLSAAARRAMCLSCASVGLNLIAHGIVGAVFLAASHMFDWAANPFVKMVSWTRWGAPTVLCVSGVFQFFAASLGFLTVVAALYFTWDGEHRARFLRRFPVVSRNLLLCP